MTSPPTAEEAAALSSTAFLTEMSRAGADKVSTMTTSQEYKGRIVTPI